MRRTARNVIISLTSVFGISAVCLASPSDNAWVLRGVLREGTRYIANLDDGKWVAAGELVESAGEKIKIEHIEFDHILVIHNGDERLVRMGEKLTAGKVVKPASEPTTRPGR